MRQIPVVRAWRLIHNLQSTLQGTLTSTGFDGRMIDGQLTGRWGKLYWYAIEMPS